MDGHLWIPALFAVIAMVYGALAVRGALAGKGMREPAQKARSRIALMFAAVSLLLFLYL